MAHGAQGGGGSAQTLAQDEMGAARRDFLMLGTGAIAAFGAAAVLWPFIDQMNPSADVLALLTTEVDLSKIAVGQSITVVWQGKPVFIRHRTPAEIEAAEKVDLANRSEFKDPQPDSDRVKPGKAEWLVVIGICTHLGCIPQGQRAGEMRGEYGGWFCPCHGSVYDTSGRIRKGPAPANLPVPPYTFVEDTLVRIG
jgi:ubiquinol-cytochrome c reductase iron-sulfur subunit